MKMAVFRVLPLPCRGDIYRRTNERGMQSDKRYWTGLSWMDSTKFDDYKHFSLDRTTFGTLLRVNL